MEPFQYAKKQPVDDDGIDPITIIFIITHILITWEHLCAFNDKSSAKAHSNVWIFSSLALKILRPFPYLWTLYET